MSECGVERAISGQVLDLIELPRFVWWTVVRKDPLEYLEREIEQLGHLECIDLSTDGTFDLIPLFLWKVAAVQRAKSADADALLMSRLMIVKAQKEVLVSLGVLCAFVLAYVGRRRKGGPQPRSN